MNIYKKKGETSGRKLAPLVFIRVLSGCCPDLFCMKSVIFHIYFADVNA